MDRHADAAGDRPVEALAPTLVEHGDPKAFSVRTRTYWAGEKAFAFSPPIDYKRNARLMADLRQAQYHPDQTQRSARAS